MHNFRKAIVSFFFVIVTMICSSTLQAQASRTWVSGVGDDANPCSRFAPCKTFAGTISKTMAGGEINCLDSGGFGAVSITKSISIICNGVIAGVLTSNGVNGINVNSNNISVLLDGLDFDGLTSGGTGISINGTNVHLTLRNSSIHGYALYGLNLVSNSGSRVVIQNSFFSENTQGAINIAASTPSKNTVEVLNTLIDSNGFGIQVVAPSLLVLSNSTVIGNLSGSILATGAGSFIDYGNNVIRND